MGEGMRLECIQLKTLVVFPGDLEKRWDYLLGMLWAYGSSRNVPTHALNQMDATVGRLDLSSSAQACSRVSASCRFRYFCEG
jgi:hypothetical protein